MCKTRKNSGTRPLHPYNFLNLFLLQAIYQGTFLFYLLTLNL
jgi:hypothetical protein